MNALLRCRSALLTLLFISLLSGPVAAVEKPNFIVINIDDLGYGDIGPFGAKQNRTPHLDAMAKEGRKLTSFYAAPVCSPSRASLMTGCYPKRALSIPHVLFPGNAEGLHPDEITVAELLKKQGYTTGVVGKWHLGDQPQFLPTNQGFDYYFGLPYSNDMGPAADGIKSNLGKPLPKPRPNRKGQPPLPMIRNTTVLQRVLPDDQQAIVERYTQEAVSFLWQHQDEPFFLYLPHSAVHFPLYPGKAFAGKSKNGLFGDWVEEVDWSVGQILETVKQLKLDKKTMVIFTSDNGGAPRHGAVNAPLRGGKGSTFEGGMRVPTIAWWPGTIPAGTETDAITSTMDILPTFVKLAGGTPPTDRKLDGGDIWPLLKGDENAKTNYEVFYYFRGFNLQAVRSGPWKLHLKAGTLYNLKDDIAESKDLAKQHPEQVAKLRKAAEATKDDLGVTGIGPGCRPLGKEQNPQLLIAHNGKSRPGFQDPQMYLGQGVMVGEITSTSAIVQARLTKTNRLVNGDLAGTTGVVRFVLEPKTHNEPGRDGPSNAESQTRTVDAKAENDFIARAKFTRLKPDTRYDVYVAVGKTPESLRSMGRAVLRTHLGKEKSGTVRFVVVTGMNYGKFHGQSGFDLALHKQNNNTSLPPRYPKPDRHLGYPALRAIKNVKPHFFVGTGDNIYYDSPTKNRAETIPQMRRRWHEQFVQPRYREMFASVPTYWMVDDHDFRVDDCDLSGDYKPSAAEGRRILMEQLPYAATDDKDAKTYRTHRVSRDLQVWFPENRMYRSANATPDGPEKTIWGAEQKAWLKKTLAESDATFKLLVSPTPMVGPDDLRKKDNHTNHGGFRHERDEFFTWLKDSGVIKQHFYVVCGDRHWQYHSIHPSGVEEFSSGALVDANSRPGRKPGDPKSTDPKGLIKQVYAQKEPSGGFLSIESAPKKENGPATLTFRFHDEHGTVLHEHQKTAGGDEEAPNE